MKTIQAKILWALMLFIRDGDTPEVRKAVESAVDEWAREYNTSPDQLEWTASYG